MIYCYIFNNLRDLDACFEDYSEKDSGSEDLNDYDQSIDSEDNKDDQDDDNILTLENSENCHDEEFNDLEQDIDDELVNNEAEETKAVLKKVSVLLTKVRGISRLARKSNIIQIYVQQQIKELNFSKINFIIDFHVRWNSTYLMIKRFLQLKEIVKKIIDQSSIIDGIKENQIKNLEKFCLDRNNWALLETLQKILLPLYLATKLLSGRKYPTLSLNLYILGNLKAFLNQESNDDEEKLIKKHLLNSLCYHFDSKLSKEQKEISKVYNVKKLIKNINF